MSSKSSNTTLGGAGQERWRCRQPGRKAGGDGVELTDVAEPEQPQERAQRRRRALTWSNNRVIALWEVGLGAARARVRDAKGLHDLAALVARPGTDIVRHDRDDVPQPAEPVTWQR